MKLTIESTLAKIRRYSPPSGIFTSYFSSMAIANCSASSESRPSPSPNRGARSSMSAGSLPSSFSSRMMISLISWERAALSIRRGSSEADRRPRRLARSAPTLAHTETRGRRIPGSLGLRFSPKGQHGQYARRLPDRRRRCNDHVERPADECIHARDDERPRRGHTQREDRQRRPCHHPHRTWRSFFFLGRQHPEAVGGGHDLQILLLSPRQRNALPPGANAEALHN